MHVVIVGSGVAGVTEIKKLMDQEIDIAKYKDSLLEDDFDYKRIIT